LTKMRNFAFLFSLTGFGGLVVAQSIDLALLNALPHPTYTIASDKATYTVPYNQQAALASASQLATATPTTAARKRASLLSPISRIKRAWDCDTVPTTPNIYEAVIDSAEKFSADQNLKHAALQADVPSKYTITFQNLQAASQANGYMGYTLLDTYNTNQCAAKCDNALGCQAFNIYFERSPTLRPADACPNPPGTANIFCVLWGGPVSRENALNAGQYRNDFQVVISGSNGYVLTSTLGPLSEKAINSPLQDCTGENPYMGSRFFTDNAPFDPERCRAVCEATNQELIAHHSDSKKPPRLCTFFNSYILSKNYVSQGQACAMYTQYWDPQTHATNEGQYDGDGNHFTISSSVFVSNPNDVGAPLCP
jgi:hypothetical protein